MVPGILDFEEVIRAISPERAKPVKTRYYIANATT
jgi:hypothetical protein